MSLKAKVEAIIYAAEEPVTLEQISLLLKDVVLADLASAKENAQIEQADSNAEASVLAAESEVPATGDAEPGTDPTSAGDIRETGCTEGQETSAPNIAAEESALLPELAIESAEEICPEPGPLMPQDEPASEAGDNEAPQGNAQTNTDSSLGESSAFTAPPEVSDARSEQAESSEPIAEATELAQSASVAAPESTSRKRQPKKTEQEIAEDKAVRARLREILVELLTDYASEDRGMEIRQVAGGFRMATKPEHHDVVRAFAKSLKPPIRLSLAALETLAVIAYKQPITGPEIADIRGVESASVIGTLLDRKLITTAGRKQVIGRPMQYKTSKDFLLRFGLNDVNELPSMEEFSQLASDGTIEIAPAEPEQSPSLFEPNQPETSQTGASEPETQEVGPSQDEPSDVKANHSAAETAGQTNLLQPDSDLPSEQSDAAETADSQPQTVAESSNVPEAEHPIGH